MWSFNKRTFEFLYRIIMSIKNKIDISKLYLMLILAFVLVSCSKKGNTLSLEKGDHIVLIGNNLGSRMINFGSQYV